MKKRIMKTCSESSVSLEEFESNKKKPATVSVTDDACCEVVPSAKKHDGSSYLKINKRKSFGRPTTFNDPSEMAHLIDDYFDACDNYVEEWEEEDKQGNLVLKKKRNPKPYTIAGLTVHLGFSSRTTLYNYRQREGYAEILERAVLRIEEQRNIQLVRGQGQCGGLIFDLKNNHGWKDTEHKVHDVHGQVEMHHTGLPNVPPPPSSLEEWQSAYHKMLEEKNGAGVAPPVVIDVD